MDYDKIINEAVERVFSVMAKRVSEEDLKRIRQAYELAYEAHKPQRRKSGEPYIIHPISVALIVADELKLDANTVMAAFLHDVVEDTPYTVTDIEERFGADVANLVEVVTKRKKEQYDTSKQVDNYRQLLDSVHYDIRALLVKLADRLHNMRTLSSMRPDKQMKIAGETDYFYAPLANRLGLFDVKTDLENLSFKYRCGLQYADIESALKADVIANRDRLREFTSSVENHLAANGLEAKATVYYRRPYSIWRKMMAGNKDFKHVDNRYYVRVTFDCPEPQEKNTCLRIYSLLTDMFKEKPQSFNNLIDSAKENSYKCVNVMLLSKEGVWEDVQICSNAMVESSKIGCIAELGVSNVLDWIERFKKVLEDIARQGEEGNFIESVATTLYYDDVMVFTPKGRGIILPKGSTAIDFAFELDAEIGLHAKYARINGKLASLKTELHRGDCVDIGVDENVLSPKADWMKHTQSYKAKRNIRTFLVSQKSHEPVCRCSICQPLPGGECIGVKDKDGNVTIHRRSCPEAIRLASKHGDDIIAYNFEENTGKMYPVSISIKAIDRYHLLIDIIDQISNRLQLPIDSLNTVTEDEIVSCQIKFYVHSVRELVNTMSSLYTIEGVDEVHQVD